MIILRNSLTVVYKFCWLVFFTILTHLDVVLAVFFAVFCGYYNNSVGL